MDDKPRDNAQLTEALEVAQLAVREAGGYLAGMLGRARVEYAKAPHDDVLDVDLESERIIVSRLQARFPDFGILSEEMGQRELGRSYHWIVDPLDGSVNFQHSDTRFAVAIALAAGSQIVFSVIYVPARDELYSAMRGNGATLNGRAIAVSRNAALDEAIVHIGELERIGPRRVSREQLRELRSIADRAKRVRVLGSSSADLASVACGRADAFVMHGGLPWDVAAGELLLTEAGGTIARKRYDNGMTLTLYSNEALRNELRDVLGIA